MKAKTFRIEKGIKLSAVRVSKTVSNGKPSMAGETFALLEKGDSFLVRDAVEAERANRAMRGMTSRHGDTKAFASRKVKGGTRFWRLK